MHFESAVDREQYKISWDSGGGPIGRISSVSGLRWKSVLTVGPSRVSLSLAKFVIVESTLMAAWAMDVCSVIRSPRSSRLQKAGVSRLAETFSNRYGRNSTIPEVVHRACNPYAASGLEVPKHRALFPNVGDGQ
jgi:hypothetical protein